MPYIMRLQIRFGRHGVAETRSERLDFRDLAVKPTMVEPEVIRCFAFLQRDRRPFHGTGTGRAEGSYEGKPDGTELFVGTMT